MRKSITIIYFFGAAFLAIIFFNTSCTKIEFINDSGAALSFSTDTLTFDTVFTERGSATRFFKVYNRHSKYIRISRIWLEDEAASFFRMNVDGIAGNEAIDVEIPPNDSIYIFFEVTVDPDQPVSVSPFVIDDMVNFETNGNKQSVTLEAWGQNANYLPNRASAGKQNLYTCNFNEWVWDDPKPYVLYGVLVIDSCTLVMPPGTQVYIHGGFGRTDDGTPYNDGVLYMYRNGKLRIEGTEDQPVVIQGDRLEEEYSEVSGQWGRIQLGPLSQGHLIDHAEIKNGIIGILVDSLAELTIKNSKIFNTSSSALAGYSARIVAENCLFHSSGANNVTFILGGNYNFSYCTLANYGTSTESLSASNFTCLDGAIPCDYPVAAPLNMTFRNSIIYGSSRDVISLQDGVGEQDPSFFRYRFLNCVVRVDELLDEGGHPDFFDFCNPCLNGDGDSPLFVDPDLNDYHLDSLSIAIELAKPIININQDLEGNDRDLDRPDAGCYEKTN
ncbi:MAG: hypothetical protein KDC53_17710 [Saprospiraceae bacterium]|nr:hypothetical protein [Saprospiraceae bacterium]